MSAIDRLLWDRLTSYGYQPHQVAGILGNFTQESAMNPGVENGIGAFGLAQWLGPRRKALEQFAAARGGDVSDPLIQADFVHHELTGTEQRAAAALDQSRTPGEAAAIFRRAYERPGETEANDPRRIKAAQSFFDRFNPISSASADEIFDPVAAGWVRDDPQVDPAAESDLQAQMAQEEGVFDPVAAGWVRDEQPLYPPQGSTVGDFIDGAASALARQGQGLLEGLQGAGQALAGGNPAYPTQDQVLSPKHLALLGATLKRNSTAGQAGEMIGGLVPYLAMNPALGVLYAGASTPGSLGDRAASMAGAGIGAGVGAGIGRMVGGFRPSARAAELMDQGVQPTLGQGIEQGILGRGVRKLEEASTSLPLAGATTRHARMRAADQWTRAVLGRAEAPELGITAGGKKGYEAINELGKGFHQAYEAVLGGHSVPITPQVAISIVDTIDDPNFFIAPEGREWAQKFVSQQFAALGEREQVPADMFKKLADNIGMRGRSMLKSQNAQDVDLGRALSNVDDVLSEHLSQSLPPDVGQILHQIDSKYANFKRIQRATVTARDAEGAFTPADLHRAVRKFDSLRDQARFADGGALLQDLSTAGKAIIPETLGESGTTPRALVAKLAAGGLEGASMLGDLGTYGSLAGLMGAGSTQPVQRALLGGYEWQHPLSNALQNWLPRLGASLGN